MLLIASLPDAFRQQGNTAKGIQHFRNWTYLGHLKQSILAHLLQMVQSRRH